MDDTCNLKNIDWRSYPNLDQFETRRERHSGCPKGGKDHVVIWPMGDRRSAIPRAWCRWCNKGWQLDPDGKQVKYNVPPPPREPSIPQGLAGEYHSAMTPAAYQYYADRGIHPSIVDGSILGWRETWGNSPFKRYSIPCFYPHKGKQALWSIQYRASMVGIPKNKRYISEPGSINTLLFNTRVIPDAMYLIIVESPLDALALTSYGYPAIAPFDGNAKGSWKKEWTALIKHVPEIIIVPDNDLVGTGDLLAMDKAEAIKRSRILRLPAEFKDTGELIKSDLAGISLKNWLNLPALLGSKWTTQ